MSIFYDPLTRKPYSWTFLFFIILATAVVVGIYLWGLRKADYMEKYEGKDFDAVYD
jgi:hypothetical protein